MSNKKFKLIHWDDDEAMQGFIEGTLTSIFNEYKCEIQKSEFCKSNIDFLYKIKAEKFDLIILDIEDESTKNDVGFVLLNEIITLYQNSIPVLVFSRHPRVLEVVEEFKTFHNLNIEFLNKSQRGEPSYHLRVKDKLKSLLNLGLADVKIMSFNDFNTKSALKTIGLHNLQSIISIYLSFNPILNNDEVTIKAIAPGYSGAFVIEINFGLVSKLLKISHNKSTILKEYENLKLYSIFLSSSIKIDYEKIEPIQLSNEGWYSIIYEFVSYSSTLFDFISENQDKQPEIEGIFNNLFSSERLLKLYSNIKKYEMSINENILEDIDPIRASYIMNSIKYLYPILELHLENYNQDLIDRITETHSFISISTNKLKIPNSMRQLSHADLHSDNILVDSLGSPIVIDPGSIEYKHWSFDLCRLLVDLFLRGYGYKTILYFDINSINDDFKIAEKIICRNIIQPDKINLSNNGFIIAINWITQNIDKIYKAQFIEWEFRLGLGVEFLKASYKTMALPPNKRVLSLLAGCNAIKQAENLLNAKNSKS